MYSLDRQRSSRKANQPTFWDKTIKAGFGHFCQNVVSWKNKFENSKIMTASELRKITVFLNWLSEKLEKKDEA